jgi:DNA-binding NarL/FixJ family response regulator
MRAPITVSIADDHRLFLKSIALLIGSFSDFVMVAEAVNGEDLLHVLNRLAEPPDIILMDVSMPILDGIATTRRVQELYPSSRVVALSTNDDDQSIINMIRAGCCAYLLKDMHPDEFEKAMHEVFHRNMYNADVVNINYRRLLRRSGEEEALRVNERERRFLELACSDKTYKQIASEMNISERTVDACREKLFEKFNVQSRVGLALEAVRKGIVKL